MKRTGMILMLFSASIYAQNEIWIHPNRGQWHENVAYKINTPGGQMYLEKSGFTYEFNNLGDVTDHHSDEPVSGALKRHVVKSTFIGFNENVRFEELSQSSFYENYFIGNDRAKWASDVYAYQKVNYIELYDKTDLHVYESNKTLKYDIIVHPGGNPSDIRVQYQGQDRLYIEKGSLVIETTLGTITEGKPIAYQIIKGTRIEVACEFILLEDVLTFSFPDGFDPEHNLIIDPAIIFSTYSGSTADNFGMSACGDNNGNIIAGGIAYGTGYPTTFGAFDETFNYGSYDISLSKFNETGTNLLFSTYIGGSGAESVQSIITDQYNSIYFLGISSSADFPLGMFPYQSVYSGGPNTYTSGLGTMEGSDLVICKISSNGNALIGGTYYGGTSLDGVSSASDTIAYFYGDKFRGEIQVDSSLNVFIVSTTQSVDIPMVNALDNTLNGLQDGIVAKFDPDLSSLLWSSFIGGSGVESANSLQLNSAGDIYIVGGTTGPDFPFANQYITSYLGGAADGYIIKFESPSYNSVVGTFIGTGQYNQVFFVRLDPDEYVYIYGQTEGAYPYTSGKYANFLSGQFIQQLAPDLSSSVWSSVFGAGTGNPEITPTAFEVTDCYEILVAGWGGKVNQYYTGNSSSTDGFPTTLDAFQESTGGSNFFFACFTPQIEGLKYSTFFGSAPHVVNSGDHVDGGTSRFDKEGVLFHAICASCWPGTDFPTTPGAFSSTNNSSNCNMMAVKFDMSQPGFILQGGSTLVTSQANGISYQWLDCNNSFQPVPGATNSSFTPPGGIGNYALQTSNGYCVDTSACFDMSTAQVEENEQSGVMMVFPNPFNQVTTIMFETELNDEYELIVYDLLGNVVYQYNEVQGNSIQLDLTGLASGTYLLSVSQSETGELLETVRLVLK